MWQQEKKQQEQEQLQNRQLPIKKRQEAFRNLVKSAKKQKT